MLLLHTDLLKIIVSKSDPCSRAMLKSVCKKFRSLMVKRNPDCKTIDMAAKLGFLGVCKWFAVQGCSVGYTTCSNAALNGHLDVLKWARENGCPCNEDTCSNAARNGHLDVLKWARENGCEWD